MKKLQKHLLKSGLTVFLAPRKETETVSILYGVGAGSRDESESVSGISHYIEHMNFKGTKKRPTPIDVAEFIENLGGITNAYTSKEHTSYYVKISSDHIKEAIDYLSDNVVNSINLPEEFERERGVVIEDLKMHKDRPVEEVAELFEETLFETRSLARRVGGTPASVKEISLDDLNSYKNNHYISNNSAVAIVGNFGKQKNDELLKLIENSFCLPKGEIKPRKIAEVLTNPKSVFDHRKIEQSHLVIGFPAPSLLGDDKYAVKLLARILGGSMSSRMFVEIREKRGLAYAIDTIHEAYSDAGAIFTQAGIAHDNLYQTIEAILVEYKKIINKKVSLDELNRAKEITKGGILIGLEDSENYADMLVSMQLDQKRVIFVEDIVDNFMRVTQDDIIKAAEKYLDFGKAVISVVGDGIDEEKINSYLK